MKRILFVFSLILITAFSSCKKDDTESSANTDLIGSWAEKPSVEQFIFIFQSNGQGSFQIKNCTINQILETDSFTYVFDSKTNKIDFLGFDSGDFNITSGNITFFSNTSLRLETNVWRTELYKQ